MADGGWEHIRGAYIIQHLIEGAGWKWSRAENGEETQGGEGVEEGMKEETKGPLWDEEQNMKELGERWPDRKKHKKGSGKE